VTHCQRRSRAAPRSSAAPNVQAIRPINFTGKLLLGLLAACTYSMRHVSPTSGIFWHCAMLQQAAKVTAKALVHMSMVQSGLEGKPCTLSDACSLVMAHTHLPALSALLVSGSSCYLLAATHRLLAAETHRLLKRKAGRMLRVRPQLQSMRQLAVMAAVAAFCLLLACPAVAAAASRNGAAALVSPASYHHTSCNCELRMGRE
jgi:hypothetical protein